MNQRKDKILYSLWLSKEEEKSLKESLKFLEGDSKEVGYAITNITEIIQNTFNRGDLEKR